MISEYIRCAIIDKYKNGCTHNEISVFLGISKRTIYTWLKKYIGGVNINECEFV